MKRNLFLIIAFVLLAGSLSAQDNKASVSLTAAIYEEEVSGNLDKAVELYLNILKKYPNDRQVAAKTLYHLGLVNEKMGKQKANEYFTRLVNTYPDQTEMVALAKARLAALGGSVSARGAGGLITRRVLSDASGVGEVLSADGKYIRGLDWETGDVDQYEVASGLKTRIANSVPWSNTETALQDQLFSHDGKQIVYSVESSDPITKDWLYQLRIRNLDGSGLRTFYSEKDSYVFLLDWSPDAGFILVFREYDEKENDLAMISIADGSVRVLGNISIPTGWLRAGFSLDGRFIAFSSVSGEGSRKQGDVRLMTADGRNEVVVAGHPAEDRLLGWTPDGRSLVFLSDRSGTWDIWTVRMTDGKQQGEPALLKKDFGYYSKVLGFAPDGSCYYKTITPLGGLYIGTIDLETGKVIVPPTQVITRYLGSPANPTWSPDGRNLLYISGWGFGPGKDIPTIRSAATGEEHLLTGLGFVNQMSWAPDGRSVIAIGDSGIIRIDIERSTITPLKDGGLFPKLCPDGKTLVFAYGPIIWKRNLDTGQKSEVVNVGTGGTAQWLYDLSPDGREVVFQKDSIVKIVSLNGGDPREIFRGKAQNYRLKWTSDGRYILARAGSEIWKIPAQGGTPLKLDLSIPKMNSFALHPDNRHFALTVNEGSKSELWVMENFLPK